MISSAPGSLRRRFTLIELLSAIAIVLVLAGLMLGLVKVATGSSNEAKAKTMIERFMIAMQEHYRDRGYYPKIEDIEHVGTYSDTGAVPLAFDYDTSASPPQFRGFRHSGPTAGPPFHHSQTGAVYMENMQSGMRYYTPVGRDICLFRDPWQRPYLYTTDCSEGCRVWSRGPDGNSGTDDDICSWKQR